MWQMLVSDHPFRSRIAKYLFQLSDLCLVDRKLNFLFWLKGLFDLRFGGSEIEMFVLVEDFSTCGLVDRTECFLRLFCWCSDAGFGVPWDTVSFGS